MIVIGAKGLAKEILHVLSVDMKYPEESIVFFDDISKDLPAKFFDKFKILKSIDAAKEHMLSSRDTSFVLGLGNQNYREMLFKKFVTIGGKPITTFAEKIDKGNFDVSIGVGSNIMSGAIISNSVKIGKGCLIYFNSIITHDCVLGDFVEISPSVNILGRCNIGDFSSIGTNATILPDIKIGKNVVVGAGTVVLNDIPDNSTVVGVPGKIIEVK